jgi:hypothetical protein
MVWNYKDRTVAYRQIPNLNHANFGPLESSISQPWSADSSPWGSDVSAWNAAEYTPDAARVLMASNDTKLYLLDSSTTFDGTIPSAYLERRGLTLGAPDQFKLVKGIRPRIYGNPGETITVKVGGNDTDPFADPTWDATMTHTIGTTVANDCMIRRRYPAIRFESGSAYAWRLDSYDIDADPDGQW